MSSSRQYRDPYRDVNRELPAYEATVIIRRPPRRLRVVTISVIATMSMILGILLLFRMDDEPPATGTVLVMRGNGTQRAAGAGLPGEPAAADAPDDDRSAHAADRADTGETRPAAANGSAPSHRPPRRQPLRPDSDGVKVAATNPAKGLADGPADGPADKPGTRSVNESADEPADGPANGPADELGDEPADGPADELVATRTANRSSAGASPSPATSASSARTQDRRSAGSAAVQESAPARGVTGSAGGSTGEPGRPAGASAPAGDADSDLPARGSVTDDAQASLTSRPPPATPAVRTPQEIRVPRKMLGDAGRGKGLFDRCQSCHTRSAGMVSPSRYTQKQWIRYMASTRHSQHASFAAHFTLSQLADVKAYLLDHAADVNQGRIPGVR